jgi:N-acetylmuramoyl-L-alanine amidase
MIKVILKFLLNLILGKEKNSDKYSCKPGILNGKRIVVDPGHGLYVKSRNGNSEEPIYVYQREDYDGIREDLITIEVAEHLIVLLSNEGAEVSVTRNVGNEEIGISKHAKWKEGAHIALNGDGKSSYKNDVNVRWEKANEWHKEKPVDLFVSIHFNAGGGRGAETWYYEGNARTQIIAKNIQSCTVNETNAKDRGIKPDNEYAVLKYTKMPAIIWEGAFFDNEEDRNELLKNNEYYYDAANAICKGIIKSVEEGLL